MIILIKIWTFIISFFVKNDIEIKNPDPIVINDPIINIEVKRQDTKMIFEELLTQEEQDSIIKTAAYLRTNPEWLTFLMWFEGKLCPQTVNFQHGDNPDASIRCNHRATGLIQFMPSTAIGLGTTNHNLYNMTFVEQMVWVQKYLSGHKGKYNDWIDLYCEIFWPVAVGKPLTFQITREMVVKQNAIFDINKDGIIEKSEIKAVLFKRVPDKYKSLFT